MPTPEDKIESLAAEVGEIDLADPDVQEWVKTVLQNERRSAKQLQAAFRLQRLLRDDAKMEAIAADLRRTRLAIDALGGLVR